MLRVLQMTDGMGVGGGIQSFIMNVYRNIDTSDIQFDFLLHRHNNPSFDDEIKTLGGNIYYLPGRKEGVLNNINGLHHFFMDNPQYDVVHFHASSLSYVEPLVAAQHASVPIRIMHAHSSQIIGKHKNIHLILHNLNQNRISKLATHYLACGDLAAQWMYGKQIPIENVEIVNNGIDLNNYLFSNDIRTKKRCELNIADKFVLCHVGRFEAVKNHLYLIDILKEVLSIRDDAILLLIGKGTLLQDVKDAVERNGLSDKVLFLGIRNDVNELLMASDCFLLPSFYEGFPVAAIEAQATGIPVIMSDSITKDAVLKDNVKMLSIEANAIDWAQEITSPRERIIDNTCMYDKSLDLTSSIQSLLDIYKQ